ncbi:hypothetical protein BCR42DRAFT_412272 [Absidia repens]|uniref:Uncharacterized protein n=1 Tax=Absidia repens TaxID=90262 RepID=A0A1X2IJC3_9FUNG|nr:hypothetical protein BCR42DRAFT_412272 [Absidia repens]
MNIIAPCPQKPTSALQQNWKSTPVQQNEVIDEACFELRQILLSQGNFMNRIYCTTAVRSDDPISIRTNHPLPGFTPLQQRTASDTTNNCDQQRPRSLSVGNTRPLVNLVH